MRIAYLLLVHNTPNHLHRLLNALEFDQDDFYIHIDRKTAFPFDNIRGERFFFSKERIPVYWGEFSQIEATMVLIRQALNSGNKYDYLILLSGSDYPVRPAQYIHSYLQKNNGGEFISITEMPNDKLGKPLRRLTEYRVGSEKPVKKFLYEKMFGINGLICYGYLKRDFKKFLRGLVPYGGSQWWALTSAACEYIIDFVNHNRSIYNFFKNTHCSDEMFFQTIIGNSDYICKIRRNLTYTDWEKFCPPFPATINDWHIDLFNSTDDFSVSDGYGNADILFARKFPDNSEKLISSLREGVCP